MQSLQPQPHSKETIYLDDLTQENPTHSQTSILQSFIDFVSKNEKFDVLNTLNIEQILLVKHRLKQIPITSEKIKWMKTLIAVSNGEQCPEFLDKNLAMKNFCDIAILEIELATFYALNQQADESISCFAKIIDRVKKSQSEISLEDQYMVLTDCYMMLFQVLKFLKQYQSAFKALTSSENFRFKLLSLSFQKLGISTTADIPYGDIVNNLCKMISQPNLILGQMAFELILGLSLLWKMKEFLLPKYEANTEREAKIWAQKGIELQLALQKCKVEGLNLAFHGNLLIHGKDADLLSDDLNSQIQILNFIYQEDVYPKFYKLPEFFVMKVLIFSIIIRQHWKSTQHYFRHVRDLFNSIVNINPQRDLQNIYMERPFADFLFNPILHFDDCFQDDQPFSLILQSQSSESDLQYLENERVRAKIDNLSVVPQYGLETFEGSSGSLIISQGPTEAQIPLLKENVLREFLTTKLRSKQSNNAQMEIDPERDSQGALSMIRWRSENISLWRNNSTQKATKIRKSNISKNRETANKQWKDAYKDLIWEFTAKYHNNWKRVSSELKKQKNLEFTAPFIKSKYYEIRNEKSGERQNKRFNQEEDAKIVYLTQFLGMNWDKIALEMENREPLTLKNRFYQLKRKGKLPTLIEKYPSNMSNQDDEFIDYQENSDSCEFTNLDLNILDFSNYFNSNNQMPKCNYA